MKFKHDENLGERGRLAFENAGHDVETAVSQGITSTDDESIFRICSDEGRTLITLDLDFSNPLRFPPVGSPGIAVLRLPKSAEFDHLDTLVQVLIRAIQNGEEIDGHLWIVELEKVRIYQPPE